MDGAVLIVACAAGAASFLMLADMAAAELTLRWKRVRSTRR